MADPKLPKQLSEESPLVEFAKTGNLYADPAYTSQEVIDAEPINGKSPFTGETLTFGVNTITNFTKNSNNSPDYSLAVPEDGSAYFVSNLDRGTARGNGHDYFFNYKRGNGVALADIYIINSKGGDFSASPRAANKYVTDSDGTLNVYIEGSEFGGNLMGFGSQTDLTQTFTGNYVFTFKKSQVQWFCITYGTGYGLGEGNAANNRFGTVIGNIDLLVDGSTVTNNGAVLRGGILPGVGDEKAYIKALFNNTNTRGDFGIIMTGCGDTNFASTADLDITITGSTLNNFMMLPNASNSGHANDGTNALTGNIAFKFENSTVNGLVIGAGRTGDNLDGRGWVKGDISFNIIGSTNSGVTTINKGKYATEATPGTVDGTIENSVLVGAFIGFQTGGTDNLMYADTTLRVIGSTTGAFSILSSYADKYFGTATLEISGSTTGNLTSDVRGVSHSGGTFNLVFKASEAQSTVGAVSLWTTMTVDAGANVRATSVANVATLTLKGANLLAAGTVSDVETLSVEDATLTKGDVILISGLTSYDEGNIESVMINGTEFSYGMFGGQYELVGSDLVAHLDPTYLVNDNYTGNNVETGFEGVKGYKDLAVAQNDARANSASLIFTNMDDTVDAPSFTADIATLDVVTKFVGEDEDEPLDLNGVSIIIGGDSAVASAGIAVAYAENINSIKFGTGTVTGTASIANVGSEDSIGIATLDLTGAAVADASVSVSNSFIGDVKLADNAAATGKLTVSGSTITNLLGGAGSFENDLTGGNVIENVYAEGYGKSFKLGTSTVETYLAGSSTKDAEFATLAYDDSVSAETLIIGGNANKIGKIEANVTGGTIQKLIVANADDTVSGDIDLSITGGEIEEVEIAKSATVSATSKVEVTLGGGTVANSASNGRFYGLIYGASVTGALDGGTQGIRTLTVDGYARVGSITNFDSIEVVGGTLNVESGDRKSDPTEENAIDITGEILNRRAIQAGAITAKDLTNFGMVGVLRSSADDPGILLTGNFYSDTFVRTSVLAVGEDFWNSGEVTSVGDITVDGDFSNYGQIYIRSSFDKEKSEFSQDGGIALNNVDMVNSGDAAFISTGFLKGVKNLTTNRLYVTGGADITGSLTIEAGAEVAFTNKAVKDPESPFAENGLKLGGNITMYDTSSLIVSGTVPAGKTLTIKADDDGLVGSNVLVKAEGGLNSWQISWGEGLSASSYYVARTSTEIALYSVDELFVNSAYAALEDGDEVVIEGKTFVVGVNAFGSVEDATYFAGNNGFNDAKISIYNDKSGMDVDTTYGDKIFDLVLYNSTVGAVTAKNVYVESSSTVKSVEVVPTEETTDSGKKIVYGALTIDASAVLTITDTIMDGLSVVIDATDGSGARKVVSVNPDKVTFAEGQVTVLKPSETAAYTVAFSENGDTVYLKANANVFLLAEDAVIVDGVTVDKATGDVLFAGVNAFTVEADAAAAAQAAGGTLWIADGSNKIRAIAGVSNVALEYSGGSSIYGSTGDSFVSTEDYSVTIAGATTSAKVYGLNKSVNMSGDYSFVMSDAQLTGSESALYIVGNDVNNVVDGDITAVLENVRIVGRQADPWSNNGGWNEGIYLGYGSFGTDDAAPIDVDVTLRGVTATGTGFYGIQTQPGDGPTGGSNISTSNTPADQQVRQDINANINIKVYDSILGGTFTVLNTNNEHWDAHGASLLNTYFSSGSITVEVGNSDFGGSGNWRNIRLGASLQGGGKAIQEFNVPNTLHIVATDNGTVTRAAYVNEWDTLIVDATAQLWLNNEIQYSTGFGETVPDGQTRIPAELDDAGTLTQIMINMSGYKSGTHNVITTLAGIATDATLSNITVIGDNDLTGQCQLAYAFSGDSLRSIYIFDKADDMYVNATYTDAVNGTKIGNQELLLNYNAYVDFAADVFKYSDAWGGTIVVTGGEFGNQDFHGNNVEISGATMANLTMVASEKSVNDDVTLTVKADSVLGNVDGSAEKTASSTLALEGVSKIGDVSGFDTVTVKKGLTTTLGAVSNAGFEMYADNELIADSVSFSGTEKIVLDVTAYTDKSHAIISTTNGITGFSAGMVELVAHDKGKQHTVLDNYSVVQAGNDLVLRSIVKSNTYLNSTYTAATKQILDDGTYIEYGLNAFSDATEAAANLGGQKYTLTVTGGEIADDIKLGGANFVLEEGTVNGVVYACVNTADKGGFYSGKTYTVTAGTVGGFDLTAGEGVYLATTSAINLGKDVTVTGNIIGGGDTVVTSEGKFSVGGLIMGVSEIVLNADGFLTASGINLGSGEGESTVKGTIRVKAVPFETEEGNRRLLIQSDTDIMNAEFVADKGTALYSTGKQVYVVDLSRIYFDPTFTADVDGTKAANGDTLIWNVNAFSSLSNAVTATRNNSATLYVQNANGNVSVTGLPVVSMNVTDSVIPTFEQGMTGNQSYTGDVSVVIKGSTFAANNSYILGQGAWNSRNTLNGTLYVDISDSTVSGGRLRIGTFFNAGNKKYDINFTNTEIRGDMSIIEDSPMNSTDVITVNMTGVTAPVTKWWTFLDGYPNEDGGTINLNIKDSVLGETGGTGFRFALQRNNGTSNQFNNGFKFNVSVENTTVNGGLLAEHIEGQNITFGEGSSATLNVAGDNYIRYVIGYNEVNLAAGASITGSTLSTRGDGKINVDATGYEGPTKDLIWMSTTLGGQLGEVTGLKEGYLVVKGSKALVLSDGNVTNLYVNAAYSSDVTGTTSSVGDILIFEDDASSAGDEKHANALKDLEDAKALLTAGNKLFVVANENELYGTMEDEDVTPFVNLVVTGGDFSAEDSVIAAAEDGKTVTGSAVIELAGGSIGKAGTEEDEPVYATIDGTRAAVGTTSDFILSKVGGIYADVKDFDTMTVTSEARVHGTITVDALVIDNTGFLTVDGTLDTGSIHIATAGYEGASKKVLVADELATFDETKITADEGGELFLDKANKTLWLVSTAPGNVYFNTAFTDAINGSTLNDDLLFFDANAFNAISAETIALRATSDDTVYVLAGDFGTAAVDLSGIGTRKLEFQGGKVGAFTVDAGSTVSVTGTTADVSIASITGAPVGEGELVTTGYGVTLKPADYKATIGTIDGVNYFRFNAANAANITVSEVDFLENGGQFIVDFAGYTIGDASKVTLFTAANGVNNFIQYVTPEEGEKYSRTVMETRNNNAENLMVYYDETSKSVYAVKRGNAAFYDPSATNAVNGTTEVVDGVTNTKVYGFNVSNTSISNIVSGLNNGDTLVVTNANRDVMVQDKDVNAIITNSTVNSLQLGYTSTSHERTGSQTVLIKDSTITADTALAGRSDDENNRLTLIVGDDVEGELVGGYDYTFQGGAHTNNTNKIRVTQNANIRGNTVSVTFDSYTFGSDMELFNNVWNSNGQLNAVNVTFKDTVVPDSKWMWIWDPREANNTTINLTITDTYFGNNQDRNSHDTALGILGNDVTEWGGVANVTISGATSTGRLSAARGIGGNSGSDALDTGFTEDSKRYLSVQNNGANATSDIYLVNMFSQIDVASDAFLTGGTISMSATNTGFVLYGKKDVDYGRFKEYVSVSGAINNASGAKFIDEDDKETEIEGYSAVVGSTNVFIYKKGALGDIFYSRGYSASASGQAVKNADGTDTVLVYGENAFSKVADAYTALEASAAGTAFQIEGANDASLYTFGYKTLVNGGNITTLFGGAAPDTTDPENPVEAPAVASVDITVNSGAAVKNVTVANELSQVTGNALVTIADGVTISGTIDAATGFVGGNSDLVFTGAATAGSIVGFDTVTLNANEVVSVTGAITGAAITIDATGFTDFSKKVLTATDITVPADGITVINGGANTFGWQIVADGEGKALLITSDLVKDTYANAAWTPETELGFVGDTALVWDKNAFNSAAAAAANVGEGNVLYIDGGIFSSEEAVTLAKNNDVVIEGDASIGALTTGGKLTANKALTAASIDGVSGVDVAAGSVISVSGGVALAENAKISIDVTGYKQDTEDVVILSTGTGVTIDTAEGAKVIDNTVLTVTGEGAGAYYAYYGTEDSSVHLLKLNTFYLDSGFEGGVNVPEYSPYTGEKLIYTVNAFDRMNAAGAKMVDGQKFWATHRNGSIHTGGPDMAAGEDGKFLSEVHVVESTVDRIVIGGTTGEAVYVGDTHIFVDKSTIATDNDNDSWLVSSVTADNPWSHRNTLFGTITVDVTDSTIGTAATPGGTLRILNYTNVVDRSAEKKSSVNVNFTNTEIYKAVRFLGDSPMGKDVVREDFSKSDLVEDGGIGTTEVYNINLDNVTVGGEVEWAIRGGGSRNQVTGGTVTVNMKDTTFGASTRFAIEDNWSEGNVDTDMPKNGSDFIFNVENTTINGYLIAGRRNYTSALADLSVTSEGYGYSGKRELNVIGSNTIKNALFFKNINLTGDSSLQGDSVTLFNGNGLDDEGAMVHVDGKINVDLTGYTGASRYLVSLNFTYDEEGAITGGGIVNFDPTKSLVVTGLAEPAEGEEPAYKLVTDYDAETKTISKIVLKSAVIKDVFLDSTFNEDDFDPVLGKASKNGDAMFYGENAFSTMVADEEEEIPGALPVLQANPNAVLRVVGGVIETETLFGNSITIDAGATLAYQGSTAITVDGFIQNDGNFVIDATEFIKGAPDRVTILVADEILGKAISVTTKTYAVETALNETTNKWEITLVRKAEDVYVNTEWADATKYPDGTEVTIGEKTAYVGYTAFGSADTALTKVNTNGTITVIASDVSFTNPVARGITVFVDGTSSISKTTIGSDTDGALVLQAGAVGTGLNLQGKSVLTVNAGAKVTGGLGMTTTATALFDNDATLDFYIVGQNKIEGPRVTNLSSIGESTPNFTVTIDAGIKDGAYQLASGAAGFGSSITLQTESKTYGELAFGEKVFVEDLGAYFQIALDDNNNLTLKKEASQDVIYVNSAWTTEGQVVTVDGTTVTVGENGFADGDKAVEKAISSGATTIKVVGGVASFTDGVVITTLVQNAELQETDVTGTLTVSETATLSGKFTFAPAEGKTITVNGTVAFDTVNTTKDIAQVTGLSKAAFGDSAKFTLKVTGEVESGDSFLLATGAEGFASTVSLVGSDVVLTVGETEIIGGLGYRLSLTDGNLVLNITDKPVPSTVFVNSTWTAADGDTVQISDTVTATMGYDAFKNGNAAYSAVASDGEIVVLGGVVNFTNAIDKNLTINDGATLTGKAAFAADTLITINGTILFDTQYAATVQISGLANSEGTTKFELVDNIMEAGDYLLASDAAGFIATVKFGENSLTVGGPEVEIDDLNYSLAIDGNNTLVLTVTKDVPPTPTTPTQTYANSEWSTLADGAIVTVAGGTAKIGYDAFALLADAIAGVTDDGKINVTGGTVSFTNGYSKTITVDADATVVGKAAFDKAITINGTVMFDTAIATATAAQITGFNLISGDANFSLTDVPTGTDTKTFRLASDVVSFNKPITIEGQALTLTESVQVNGYDYSLALDAGNLTLTVSKNVPPTPPTGKPASSDIDGNGISDVMFVWTGNNYQHGYWMNGTSEWASAGSSHPAEWENLGCYDMTGNGKADSVLVGNVTTETTGKGAYIGFYTDAIDNPDGSTWQNIGYLTNAEDVVWKNKVGNLTGNEDGINSIVWYAPERYALGAWTDGTESWVSLTNDFGGDDWTLVGCGDFDGDGKDSVVMSGLNGQYFYIVGIEEAPTSLGSANWANWEVRAIGDFSGDGKDDIVLFHSEYGSMVMLADGNLDNYTSIGQLDKEDWFVVGAGDYNDDQKDDLLVRQYSTGMLGYYSAGDTTQWNVLGYGVDMNWTVIA